MKERLEEIGRKDPIGKCDCINNHHKDVIIAAIDTTMRTLSSNITEIKNDARKRDMYNHVLKSYINERTNLEATRMKLTDIPECPD